MQEQYRREIDNIHAPKDLIEKTRKQMRAEMKQEKKKSRKPIWIGTVAAACVCITVLGGYIYIGKVRNNIEVQTVAFRKYQTGRQDFRLEGKTG